MRTLITRSAAAAALAIGLALPAFAAHAQALGPQRQFLAIEPYYTRFELDRGVGVPGGPPTGTSTGRVGVNAYGARLWINLAPFAGPSPSLLGKSAIALFYTYGKRTDEGQKGTLMHYGAQVDQFLVDRPLGGIIDPVISLGVGALRRSYDEIYGGPDGDVEGASKTNLALSPGVGIRIPVPNRFQLRFDARDAITFKGRTDGAGKETTANNLEFIGAIGITF